ncbi:hypothetical protein ABH897_002604 [Paenibacillus sp. RC73]
MDRLNGSLIAHRHHKNRLELTGAERSSNLHSTVYSIHARSVCLNACTT